MSGPKSSYYILTEVQRRILEEQRREALEKAKAEGKLNSSLAVLKGINPSNSFDNSISLECIDRFGNDFGYSELFKKITKTIQSAQKIRINTSTANSSEIYTTVKRLDNTIGVLKTLLNDLKKTEEKCKSKLRGSYAEEIDAAFSSSFADEIPVETPKEEKSIDLSFLDKAKELCKDNRLPKELIEKLFSVIKEAKAIDSSGYIKNFKAVVFTPLINECNDFLEYYEEYHDKYDDLINEYFALCKLYGYEAKSIPFAPDCIVLLEKEINTIKQDVAQSEEQTYIQNALDEVMSDMGYSVIGNREVTKKNGKHFRNELFTYGEGTAVSVTYSPDGKIAMELGGLDHYDRTPTEKESVALCAEMESFCGDFKEIEKRLLEKGVIASSRISLLPPDIAYAQIINTSDYKMQTDVEEFTAERQQRKTTSNKAFKLE